MSMARFFADDSAVLSPVRRVPKDILQGFESFPGQHASN